MVHSAFHLHFANFLLGLFFDLEDGSDMFPWNISGLHDVTMEMIPFIVNSVRVSNPTCYWSICLKWLKKRMKNISCDSLSLGWDF
jgi:hypothetical protein